MPELLAKQRYNSADVRKQFKHVANVLQNFENPNFNTQKSLVQIEKIPYDSNIKTYAIQDVSEIKILI